MCYSAVKEVCITQSLVGQYGFVRNATHRLEEKKKKVAHHTLSLVSHLCTYICIFMQVF